ncbi:MAG: glycosyltransferase family 4 protein [Bacteroidia bacterium]
MHIALITDGIHPYVVGGMQRHSFYLAKYLAAAGHRVDLYHHNTSKFDINRLEFFTAEEKANIRSFVFTFRSLGETPGHYIRESYDYSKQIWTTFEKQSLPDFIYVKGFAGWELINQKKLGKKLPPIGVNFHGYEMFQPAPSWKEWLKYALLLRAPVKFNVQHADYLFSYGGKITPIIESLGVAKNRILEIPTGIAASWIADKPTPTTSVRKFVFVGRYERRKGLPELYRVLKKISAVVPFEFHFIGDIPSKDRWNDKRSKYHGKITETKDLQNILRNTDILVCPSLAEGMPNVIMEALASGLAVIATDTGATALMVNSETGWLIPPSNQEALQKALKSAIDTSEAELIAKKAAALKLVRDKFTWEKIAQETIEKIEGVLNK